MSCLLEAKGISKAFSGVPALEDVGLTINSGEVLALIGANGAGKSTLLKILTGVYKRDAGEVIIGGEPVHFNHPAQGKDKGLSTIYQELTVIPNLDVCENIFLTRIKHCKTIPYKKLYKEAEELIEELDLPFKATDKVGRLSVANQQMVEIARAISEKAKVLIMDEPTSALTVKEKDKLFDIVRKLRDQGMGLVFVSHRMNEIFEICDRATILKDGKLVGHYDIKDLDMNKIVELMLGRKLDAMFPKKEVPIGDVVFSIKNLSRGDKIKDVSFDVRAGEILGLTGLMGAGRTEIARCIFGIDKPDSGEFYYKGKKVVFHSPKQASHSGFALVPEDRRRHGLVLNMTITENTILGTSFLKGWRNKKLENETSASFIEKLHTRCTGGRQKTKELSGGNQQKVVLSKWLAMKPDVLILDEPTRGIDVSAKSEVHEIIGEMVENGAAVIMISSEFDEVMGMSDRAVVLYEGTKTGEVLRKDFTEEKLMALSHGHVEE